MDQETLKSKTIFDSVNHTRLPKVLLPDRACRDRQVTKDDGVEHLRIKVLWNVLPCQVVTTVVINGLEELAVSYVRVVQEKWVAWKACLHHMGKQRVTRLA
jgi:hypothetical protein